MSYLSTDFDAIKKGQVDLLASDKEKKKSDVNALYDSKETVLNDEYGRAVDDTKESYVDDYQKNAVQKLINERQVSESMANLGLTDSGLNRTQQTAVQLSYANQKGKIDLQKQKALDELSANLASGMATIKQNRISDLSQVDTDFEALADSRAAQIYKDNVEANTAMYEAEQDALVKIAEANAKAVKAASQPKAISKIAYGTYAGMKNGSNGNVIYTDINGNTATMPKGSNPYTGLVHNDAKTDGAYDPTKVFSNGYQPNNINGKDLTPSGAEITIKDTDKPRNVWHTTGLNYYYWDGRKNKYVKLTNEEMIEVGVLADLKNHTVVNGRLK